MAHKKEHHGAVHHHRHGEMAHEKVKEHHKNAHRHEKMAEHHKHARMIPEHHGHSPEHLKEHNSIVKDSHQEGIGRVLQKKGSMEVGQGGKMITHSYHSDPHKN